MKEKDMIVIALGGNALGNTAEEQKKLLEEAVKPIVDLIEDGHKLILGHGNGPQVGMIKNAMDCAKRNNEGPGMPFPECGAMSQGYIGYHIQQVLGNELRHRNMGHMPVASIVTQVLVDENDPAFEKPTKPIGSFYTKEEAKKLEEKFGYSFKEDSGRGYRRLVASPLPKKIIELDLIKSLVNDDHIVIATGGGGIPVVEKENGLEGIPAVIDKDESAAELALEMGADMLIILTAVDKVYINFGKENQEALDKLSLNEIDKYIQAGEFAEGSMLPKIRACKRFVEKSGKGSKAVITSLEMAGKIGQEGVGTIIEP